MVYVVNCNGFTREVCTPPTRAVNYLTKHSFNPHFAGGECNLTHEQTAGGVDKYHSVRPCHWSALPMSRSTRREQCRPARLGCNKPPPSPHDLQRWWLMHDSRILRLLLCNYSPSQRFFNTALIVITVLNRYHKNCIYQFLWSQRRWCHWYRT